LRLVKEHNLAANLKDPKATRDAVSAGVEKLDSARTGALTAVDDIAGSAIPTSTLSRNLEKARKGLKGTTAGDEVSDGVHGYMETVWAKYGGAKGKLTATELRAEISDLRKMGFAGDNKVSQAKAAVVKRRAADALEDTLSAHMDAVAKANPKNTALAQQVAKFKANNQDLKTMIYLRDAAEKRYSASTLAKPEVVKPNTSPLTTRAWDATKDAARATVGAAGKGATKALAQLSLMARSKKFTVDELQNYADKKGIKPSLAGMVIGKLHAEKKAAKQAQWEGTEDWSAKRERIWAEQED
jgi:hypothetical protein